MVGAPGAGKTMLGKCLRTILPPWSFEEALETSRMLKAGGASLSRPTRLRFPGGEGEENFVLLTQF
jgi:predicted ATPase with chaperone activity